MVPARPQRRTSAYRDACRALKRLPALEWAMFLSKILGCEDEVACVRDRHRLCIHASILDGKALLCLCRLLGRSHTV